VIEAMAPRAQTAYEGAMKKLLIVLGTVTLWSSVALAFAPTLKNEDSKSYNYKVICGGSTTNSSINGNTETSLTTGDCTLEVEGAGSAKLKDDLRCVIKDGSLSCS
jgi:hypothetical protein